MKPRVVLIDLSALFHPAWRANENGPVSVAFESTIGGVNRINGMFPDALIAVCCDGKGNWRKEVSPEYKAQRDKLPDLFYEQFARTKERLRADGRLLWEFEGFEADDVIATATGKALEAGHRVTIATHDKDLFQLVRSGSCDVLSLSTWEVRTEDDVRAKFKVPPRQIASFLALTGDASDNVPGCEKCGPVNAAKLLAKYETAEDVCNGLMVDIVELVGPALAGKIAQCRDAIRLSAQLVALKTDVPLNFDEIYAERKVMPITDLPKDDDFAPDAEVSDDSQALTLSDSSSTTATPAKAVEPSSSEVVVEYERGLEPRSFREALIMGKHLVESRLYQRYGNADAIAAVIVRGRELGLGALTALDAFHIVEGRPSPFAYLVIAMCRKHPDCEYLLPIEQDEKHCIAETKHRKFPTPIRLEFTYAQAEKAQLPRNGQRGPNGWLKNPEDMLVKTALAKLGRRIYSDAALGLTSLEELGEV